MNRRHNRRSNRADFLEQIRGAQPIDLGAGKVIQKPATPEEAKHYVFEKRMQVAASIYGTAMALIMTSQEWPQAPQQQKDETSETFAGLAWDRAIYLLQEAGLGDIVRGDPPQGATGGQDHETQEEDAAQPLPGDDAGH